MKDILVTAVHTIYRSGDGRVVPSGNTDKDGRIITKPVIEIVNAGDEFRISDEQELRFLLRQGAIEILDPGFDELITGMGAELLAERNGGDSAYLSISDKHPFEHEKTGNLELSCRFNRDLDDLV